MTGTTTDRGDIIHFAGFHHLSPARDERGAPAFSAAAGDGLARCGWERFFRALSERALAVARDPQDGSSARFVPWAPSRRDDTAPEGAAGHGGLAGALEHSRRFWKALVAPRPPPGASGG